MIQVKKSAQNHQIDFIEQHFNKILKSYYVTTTDQYALVQYIKGLHK